MIFLITLIIFALGTAAFFSGSETAFTNFDKLSLYSNKTEKMISKKKRLDFIFQHQQYFIIIFLIGTNIALVSASSLFSYLLKINKLTENIFISIGFSFFILIFSEVMPKISFRNHSQSFSFNLSGIWISFYYFFFPLAFLLNETISFFLKILHLNPNKELFVTREELENIFQNTMPEMVLDEKEKEMLSEVFAFGDTLAHEIMTPLTEVIAIEKKGNIANLFDIYKTNSFSKIPVYEDRIYKMIGYIDINSLFSNKVKLNHKLSRFIKKPYYVPEMKKIDDLFFEMSSKNKKIAFLVDEYGGVSGIVTMRDIAEEIVGELNDFDEPETKEIKKRNHNQYSIDASIDIDDLNDELKLDLPTDGYATLAGFILTQLGRIPKQNEIFTYKNLEMTITKCDARTIYTVSIKIKKDYTRSKKKNKKSSK